MTDEERRADGWRPFGEPNSYPDAMAYGTLYWIEDDGWYKIIPHKDVEAVKHAFLDRG
jgi:hypothetical protein